MGLFDNNLNVVVEYTYDSWGNVVSISGSLAETLGKDNPFRYRGYYFDNDTGLYYLNSRYYDANTGRFINADGFVQTGQGLLDKNMFAYCMNNPVNLVDENGDLAVLIAIGVIAGCTIGGAIMGARSKEDLYENAMQSQKEREPQNPLINHSLPSPIDNENSNNSDNSKKTHVHNKQNPKSNPLSTKQRVRNTFIGAAGGLLVGSGVVMITGVVLTFAVGVTLGAPVVATGMVAFGVFGAAVAPFLGIEMELIEWAGE